VRYFFIADRVKSKEILIEYCPTGIMIADYFTKPIQGLIFQQLRDMIMGNTDIALPTEQARVTTDQTKGIPAVSTQQESRSVLGKEMEIDPSPPPNKILSNFGPQANGPACEPVCAGAHTCSPICASASVLNPEMYVSHTSPDNDKVKRTVNATPALSWDDVARKGKTRDIKGIGNTHYFNEN
jgi:hypothetical protein